MVAQINKKTSVLNHALVQIAAAAEGHRRETDS
jgi:hypothetical protein